MLVRAKLGNNILIDFIEECVYINDVPSPSQPQDQELILLKGLIERNHDIYSKHEIAFDIWKDMEWDGRRNASIKNKVCRIKKHLGGPSSIILKQGSGYQINPNIPIEVEIKQLRLPDDSNSNTSIRHNGSGLGALLDNARDITLDHNMPPILDRYIARPKEAEQLKELLNKGHKQIFITGQGGIGKTEFAVSFATSVSHTYECFFTIFKNNVEETVMSLNFEGWSAYEEIGEQKVPKSREKHYSEKLGLLKKLGRDCLLIIDNADVPPDQLLTDPKWKDLERLDIKQLYTTRYEFDKAHVALDPFSAEQLFEYLNDHYISKFSFPKSDIIYLIESVDCHTLTVDIIGRLLKTSNGRTAPKDIVKALKENKEDDYTATTVSSEYNRDYTKRSVFEHLQTVFNLASMSKKELYIMQCASFFSLDGMNRKFFLNTIGVEHTISLDSLCEGGWLRYRNNDHIAMHPLIKTVIFYGKDTQPVWKDVEFLASSLVKECKDSTLSNCFLKDHFRSVPWESIYDCLSNMVQQLEDIPYQNIAEICDVLAWELYFLNESASSARARAVNFWRRLSLLNTSVYARESMLIENSLLTEKKEKTVSQVLPGLAKNWFRIGCLFANFGDHDYNACYAFRKAAGLLLNSENPDYYLIADCYGYAAYAFYQQGNIYQTIRFLKKAKSVFKKAGLNKEAITSDCFPPSSIGFSYPNAMPISIAGFYENINEYWGYRYTLEQMQTAQQIPQLLNGSRKIYVDPSR